MNIPTKRRVGRLVAAGLVIVAGAAGAAIAVSASSPDEPVGSAAGASGTISVTGTGTVTVEPDTAVLSLGVEARSASGTEAMDDVRAGAAALADALADAGIDPDDVQTSSIDLWSWHRDEGTEPAYQASVSLAVTIHDIDAVGPTIDSAQAAAGEGFTIGGVAFSFSDPESVLDEARRDAVAHARSKAEQFADEAGVTIGALVQLAEEGATAPELRQAMPAMEMAMDDAAPPLPVSPGTLEFTVNVDVTYTTTGG